MKTHYGYLTPKRNIGADPADPHTREMSERKVGHVSLSKGQYLTLQKRHTVTGICKPAGLDVVT